MNPAPRPRLEGIDVLRGLAALWVAFSHFMPHWNRQGHAPEIVPHEYGVHAVELFFVISGFVIFMTLGKCRSVGEFAFLRFSRIYPAYWAGLCLSTAFGVFAMGDPFWAKGFIANLTLLQQFAGIPHIDNVYWSLTVELAFYFHAAWLFALGWHKRPLRVAAAWLAASAAWAVWARQPGADARDAWSLFLALDYAPWFSLGLAFFEGFRTGGGIGSARAPWALAAAAFAVECLIGGREGAIAFALIAGLFALAVSGRMGFLVSRPSMWLGALSYAFYLIHRNLGYAVLDLMQARGMSYAVAVPIAFALAIALAIAVHYGVERPALGGLRAWWEKRSFSRLR